VCLAFTRSKIYSLILVRRLAGGLERAGVFNPAQEGNRDRRNTRRQAMRLQEIIQVSRTRKKPLYVVYLDLANYFNSIPIQKTLLILRKLGLSEEDIALLREYYQGAWFRVRSTSRPSARIGLRRGLKQGDPLSPLLGAVVAEIISRRLDELGKGLRISDRILLSHLFFVDDATLAAWSIEDMADMLRVVQEVCDWLGIDINLAKTEVSAYDYGVGRELDTASLRLGGRMIKRLDPHEAFEYLGIRLSLVGVCQAEREYVIEATRSAVNRLYKHPYSPSQVHWLIESAIISKFRYSCPFVDWTPQELEALGNEWARAGKWAHHVPSGVASVHFRAGRERGGLGFLQPVAVLARECMALLVQCMRTEDDLSSMMRGRVREELASLGCANWAEYSSELRLTVTPHSRLSSFFKRMAWSMGELGSLLRWPSLGINGEGGGLMAASHAHRSVGQPEPRWVELLRGLVTEGVRRFDQVARGGKLCLPRRLQFWRLEAGQLAEILGLTLEWQRATPTFRVVAGCRGQDLVGGRVRIPAARGEFWAGQLTSYDHAGNCFSVTLDGGGSRTISAAEARAWWTWDGSWRRAQDLSGIGRNLVRVVGHEVVVGNPGPSPHATLRQVDGETTERISYRCLMFTGYDSTCISLANQRPVRNNVALARHLCDQRLTVWLDQRLWPDWPSSRGGWWVCFTAWEQRERRLWLEYVALDAGTEHDEGDISMDCVVRNIGWVGTHVESWETERSLGVQLEGNLPSLVRAYWDERRSSPPGRRGPPPSPGREEHQAGRFAPYWADRQVDSSEAIGAVRNLRLDWTYARSERTQVEDGSFIRAGGRAYLEGEREQLPERTLRRAGPRAPCRAYPLDAARVSWVEDMTVTWWKEMWEAQARWEQRGGRSVSWTVLEFLRRSGRLTYAVTPLPLSVYPALGLRPDSGRPLLLQYEGADMQECRRQAEIADEWVLIAAPRELLTADRRWLNSRARLLVCWDSSDQLGYGKNWWKSGERKRARFKRAIQVWVSRGLAFGPLPEDLGRDWVPPEDPPPPLQRYLRALPSGRFRCGGEALVATDGALRLVNGIRCMGAAVVHDRDGSVGRCKVGGICSSTRAELAAITLAVEEAQDDRPLRILVDSDNSMTRLNWFRRIDFRPLSYKIKDLDVIRLIVAGVSRREQDVILTKVSGHTGDVLHGAADTQAIQAAEGEDELTRFEEDLGEKVEVCWEGETLPWPSRVVQFWNRAAAERYWREEGVHTAAARFLGMLDVGRQLLGEALRDLPDWMVGDWMRVVNQRTLTTASSRARGLGGDPTCCLPGCQGGAQTVSHLLLHCGNSRLSGVRIKTHDRIVDLIRAQVGGIDSAESFWAPTTVGQVFGTLELGSQLARLQPDGIVRIEKERTILVLEVARTMDHNTDFFTNRAFEKRRKYAPLCAALVRALPGWTVRVCDFVVGVKGSLPTARWSGHLSAIGISRVDQRKLLTRAIRCSLEGTSDTLKVWRREL
jgi:ribonuclease HI